LVSSAKRPIIFIVGSTAVGKTATALQLAEHLGTEIIGADSMQIYEYMDIGTGKPTPPERARVRHHLVDCVHPSESYSVGRYREDAGAVLDRLHGQGKVPMVVGGTGLYIRALTDGLFEGPEADPPLRNRLKESALTRGPNALYEKLKAVDPVSSNKIHPNDERRLIRALEVYEITGRPISELQEEHRRQTEAQYQYLMYGLTVSRNRLYPMIEARVDRMIERGLVDEVRSLLAMGVDKDAVSMQGLGYKQLMPFITHELPLENAVEHIKQETRRFAKRQITWFKADSRIQWIDLGSFRSVYAAVEHLIERVDRALAERVR
jgi:tRNA dimethylallyltransferase